MSDNEKYGHAAMTVEDLEARIAADLYALSGRFRGTSAEAIGGLLYQLMRQTREAFRTAQLILPRPENGQTRSGT